VFLVEDLLNPIKPDAPAGQSLRYEPIYDQIAEARSEEDATLPVGQWARQAKRADFPLVLSLSREALMKRSKDLWLAAWFGEANVKQYGLSTLSAVIDLLLGLQERFWDTLFPEIDEGDQGLRAAPLQWAIVRYSDLIYELPVVADSVSYRDYMAARTPGLSETAMAIEDLDAALAGTGKAFYVSVESQLIDARASLERLYLFCDERYRDDGPSFVKIRTAIDEILNLTSSLLRAKRESDPDPVEIAAPEPDAMPVAAELPQSQQEVVEAHVPEPKPEPDSILPAQPEPATPLISASIISEPQSRSEALDQIRRCVAYLFKSDPSHPVPYLLLAAIHSGEMRVGGLLASTQPPPSELRMSLKKASREGNAQQLLEESMRALAQPGTGGWLDLHRYVWLAGRGSGHQALMESVLDTVRVMLRYDSSYVAAMFEDDTPAASQETKQWVEAEMLLTSESLPEPEVEAATSTPTIVYESVSVERPTEQKEPDVAGKAESLAAGGDLAGSIQLLIQDAASSSARRVAFQRRLQAARLCVTHNQKLVASRLLQQLLAEADEYRLESWEGAQLVAEVIALLLQSSDEKGDQLLEREGLLARLCQIDPARALSFGNISVGELNGAH
jgi:type VI secretion system protein ImpA